MNRLFHFAVTHNNVLIHQDKSLLVIKFAVMLYDRINILIMSVSSFNVSSTLNVFTQSFADPVGRSVGQISKTLAHNVLIRHRGQSIDTGSYCAEKQKQNMTSPFIGQMFCSEFAREKPFKRRSSKTESSVIIYCLTIQDISLNSRNE